MTYLILHRRWRRRKYILRQRLLLSGQLIYINEKLLYAPNNLIEPGIAGCWSCGIYYRRHDQIGGLRQWHPLSGRHACPFYKFIYTRACPIADLQKTVEIRGLYNLPSHVQEIIKVKKREIFNINFNMPNYPITEVFFYAHQKQPRNTIIIKFATFEQRAF